MATVGYIQGLHLQSIIPSNTKINYVHDQLFEAVAESSILKIDSFSVPNLSVLSHRIDTRIRASDAC